MNHPLQLLAGLRLLAVADVDNLAISARRILNSPLNPSALWSSIRRSASRLKATAILTTKPDLKYTIEEWSSGGWEVVPIFREHVETIRGTEHLANADLDIAFETGAMISGHPHADALLLLSGDGTLVSSIARDVRRRRPTIKIFAAAVLGTDSCRLRNRMLFDGFISLDQEFTHFHSLTA